MYQIRHYGTKWYHVIGRQLSSVSASNLNSRDCFVIYATTTKAVYLWKGSASDDIEERYASKLAAYLNGVR